MQDRILKATQELFFEIGAEKITMRDIAVKCNISLGHLTHYFRKKEDIIALTYEALLLKGYNRFPEYFDKNERNPWVSFTAVNYAVIKAATETDSQLEGFIYIINFPSARESYISASSNQLYRCLRNTPYARDRESVWLASTIGCGGEFEAINAYKNKKGKYEFDELLIPAFSARMFLLDLSREEISEIVKKGIKKGKIINCQERRPSLL
jgi:AcrR family transcriptional regulator